MTNRTMIRRHQAAKDAGITWALDGHISSTYCGLHAVTLPGWKCWVWAIMAGDVPTGRTGVGFGTEELARADAERVMVEMGDEREGGW